MRLELSDGNSHKFWAIRQSGSALDIRWGRIGTPGQQQQKSFKSPAAAKAEHDKLVASKLKKGYVAASSSKQNPATTPKAKPAKVPARPVAVAAKATAKTSSAKPAAKPRAGTPSLTRPQRDVSLEVLSGLGLNAPALAKVLPYRDRARYVEVQAPTKQLLKFRRLTKLQIFGRDAVAPPWFSKLRHLRSLVIGPKGRQVPSVLAALPHLHTLSLDSSSIESLDGIEHMPALESVTFTDTPVAERPTLIKDVVKRIPKARDMTDLLSEIAIPRRKPAALKPKAKPQLIKALQDDALADRSDLRNVDLRGATFEDLYVSHDLRGANLAGTTWLRCDFDGAQLASADLTGATFYDCFMDRLTQSMFANIKGQGVTFVGCGGNLDFTAANLAGARLLDMDPDAAIKLERANAQGLTLQASFVSEKEHQIRAKGADLRGATIRFDITPARRASLPPKANRLAWKTDHLKGAKIDKTTIVEYAQIDTKARAHEATVDPKGKALRILGRITAETPSLWLLVVDAELAAGWRGAVDENDDQDDFERALAVENGTIEIGDHEGVLVSVGARSGRSPVLGTELGCMLFDVATAIEDRTDSDRAIALRAAQWGRLFFGTRVAKLACPSGVIALLLPSCSGVFSAKELARAKAGEVVADKTGGRLLVPMPEGEGTYEVSRFRFRPDRGRGDYEDEAGAYGDAVEISLCDKLPKQYRR